MVDIAPHPLVGKHVSYMHKRNGRRLGVIATVICDIDQRDKLVIRDAADTALHTAIDHSQLWHVEIVKPTIK